MRLEVRVVKVDETADRNGLPEERRPVIDNLRQEHVLRVFFDLNEVVVDGDARYVAHHEDCVVVSERLATVLNWRLHLV